MRPSYDPARMRAAQDESGLSNTQLAARCGVTETAVRKWRDGAEPLFANGVTLAEALGVKPKDLLTQTRKA